MSMKDLPHHMKKLNRRVVRTERRLMQEDKEYAEKIPAPPKQAVRPKKQVRKQAKAKTSAERKARTPTKKSAEERNWEMKKRVPVFDRNKAKPKAGARPSKKKRPRL